MAILVPVAKDGELFKLNFFQSKRKFNKEKEIWSSCHMKVSQFYLKRSFNLADRINLETIITIGRILNSLKKFLGFWNIILHQFLVIVFSRRMFKLVNELVK